MWKIREARQVYESINVFRFEIKIGYSSVFLWLTGSLLLFQLIYYYGGSCHFSIYFRWRWTWELLIALMKSFFVVLGTVIHYIITLERYGTSNCNQSLSLRIRPR